MDSSYQEVPSQTLPQSQSQPEQDTTTTKPKKEDEKNKEKATPKSFFEKYSRVISIVALVLAVLLLIYTIYRVVPAERAAEHAQSGGKKHGHRGRRAYGKGKGMKGGSCGCAAGGSQDTLPVAYGGVFGI